jgi:hypothetical protein
MRLALSLRLDDFFESAAPTSGSHAENVSEAAEFTDDAACLRTHR